MIPTIVKAWINSVDFKVISKVEKEKNILNRSTWEIRRSMEKISCVLTLNHTHLSQPYIKSIDFLRDEGENKQNMLIFVSGCSTPLNLSTSETSLLNKGLGYCPTPRSINVFELNQDLESFCRRMRLKEFFFDKQQDTDGAYSTNPFKPKSSWNPPKRNHHLEIFLDKVCSDIKQIELKRHVDNLSANERHALRALRRVQWSRCGHNMKSLFPKGS